MVKSRYYEQTMEHVYMEGKMPLFNMAKGPVPGEMHLSHGQEPCAVGVCAHLDTHDVITATHRSHHVAIAKGVDLKRMTAEIFGKAEGLSGGRGGHMHLFDPWVNFSCTGIVAQGCGPAVGAALAFQMKQEPYVAVSYIGEGAVNQGGFHESCNLAALWKLPVVFVIEDNAYGISVPKEKTTAIKNNALRAAGYGMPGFHVPENNTVDVFAVAGEAIARARNGQGPTLIEIETYRMAGHFMGDTEDYRPDGEVESIKNKDPIPRMSRYLVEEGIASEAEIQAVEQLVKADVDEAYLYARNCEYPPQEDALTKVFV